MKKKYIIETNGKLKLYINRFGPDEDIPYNDLKYIRNKLFIEIVSKDGKINNVKLDTQRTFNNNNFFSKKNNEVSEKEIIEYDDLIPKYIKENFEFVEEEECYYKKSKKDNIKVTEMYYYNAHLYVVEEKYKNYIEKFDYSTLFEDIHWEKINGDIEVDSFWYDPINQNCYTGKCNDKKIEYFLDKYIKKLNNNVK